MLKQKFALDFASKIIIQLTTAISGIVVARIAGPEVVGTIAYATAYVSIFAFITGLFGTAHIKQVSEGCNEEEALGTYSRLFGISVLIYIIIVVSVLVVQKYYLNYDFKGNDTVLIIFIIFISTTISFLFGFSQTVFVAKTEQANANVPSLFVTIINNSLRILVVLLGMGAIALAGVRLISALLGLPIVLYLLRNKNFGKFNKKLAKRYISIGIPIFTVVITNSIMRYSDKLILEYIGNVTQIGLYTAAYSIGGFLILIGSTAGTLFFPMFSKYIANKDFNSIREKINQFERFAFVFILPFIISLSLFSHPIMLTLLGAKYEQSAPLFSLLVFASFFVIWGMSYGNILSGLGLFWLSSLINFLKFIVFISALTILIHPRLFNLGAMALAITQLIINIFLFLMYYIISYRKMKIQFVRQQLKFILFWIIIYILSFYLLLPQIDHISIYIQSLILLPGFLVLVYLIQIPFGLLTKSDVHILLQTIHIGKILQYAKHEIKSNSHNGKSASL